MKKLFRGAMLGDRSSRWSVIAVVITFLAAGYGQGAADVSVGGATSASQQCLETDWVARYDDVFNLYDAANAITVDSDRNSYVTGEICALVDPLYGLCSVTGWGTVKYDPNGNQLWVQTFRGPGSWFNRPNAIAVDSANNVYVTGSISITPGCDVESCDPYGSDLDYATIKYSSAGRTAWVARYSGVGSGVDEAFAPCFGLLGKCLCDRVEQRRQWAVRLRDNQIQLNGVSDLGRSLQRSRQCLRRCPRNQGGFNG